MRLPFTGKKPHSLPLWFQGTAFSGFHDFDSSVFAFLLSSDCLHFNNVLENKSITITYGVYPVYTRHGLPKFSFFKNPIKLMLLAI